MLQVREPRTLQPVAYESWAEFRQGKPEDVLVYRPCGRCWQQGRILHPDGWRTCDECLGTGQRLDAGPL